MLPMLLLCLLLGAPISALPEPVAATTASTGWEHGWDTAASSWWGYAAMNGENGVFTDAQVTFLAKTYKIVLFSMCAQASQNISVTDGILDVTARLKAVNPTVKVLQYFNVQMWACYLKTDPLFAEFLAHPEMWLKDDHGNAVKNQFGPVLDYTNDAAVNLLVTMVTHDKQGKYIIDGFLFDGGAVYPALANISTARNEVLKQATWKAIGLVQQAMTARNGGLVLANGMKGGPVDPTVNDPYNLGVLTHVNGVENERGSPVFELVDHATGAFRKDAIAANLAAIETAATLANGSKVVSINYWPGPIVGFKPRMAGDNASGLPIYAAGDKANVAPSGTKAQVYEGWQKILTKWLPFNLAMFLTVAGPSTYFNQMVWYASMEGTIACPEAPDSCMAPTPFYPTMQQPLGAPHGPRVQISAYKWSRAFEHATVTVDLDDPLGPGTAIVRNDAAPMSHAVQY